MQFCPGRTQRTGRKSRSLVFSLPPSPSLSVDHPSNYRGPKSSPVVHTGLRQGVGRHTPTPSAQERPGDLGVDSGRVSGAPRSQEGRIDRTQGTGTTDRPTIRESSSDRNRGTPTPSPLPSRTSSLPWSRPQSVWTEPWAGTGTWTHWTRSGKDRNGCVPPVSLPWRTESPSLTLHPGHPIETHPGTPQTYGDLDSLSYSPSGRVGSRRGRGGGRGVSLSGVSVLTALGQGAVSVRTVSGQGDRPRPGL